MASEYRCPVCGVNDPNAYLRCNHPGCTDGRDPRPTTNAPPMTEPLTLAQQGAALTSMQDHIDRFWRMLETERVRLLVGMRRDTTSVPYWDSSSFPVDVAKALVADRVSLRDANKALTAERDEARQSWSEAVKLYEQEVARVDPLLAKLAKVEETLADPIAVRANILAGKIAIPSDLVWLHHTNGPVAAIRTDRDRISAELAEARKLLEKSLHDFAPVSAQNHKRDVAAFLASKEASHDLG